MCILIVENDQQHFFFFLLRSSLRSNLIESRLTYISELQQQMASHICLSILSTVSLVSLPPWMLISLYYMPSYYQKKLAKSLSICLRRSFLFPTAKMMILSLEWFSLSSLSHCLASSKDLELERSYNRIKALQFREAVQTNLLNSYQPGLSQRSKATYFLPILNLYLQQSWKKLDRRLSGRCSFFKKLIREVLPESGGPMMLIHSGMVLLCGIQYNGYAIILCV